MATTNVEVIISAKDQATGVLKKFESQAKSTGESLGAAFSKGAIGAGIMLGALTALGRSAIDIASDFEQNRISFETMLGSGERAGQLLKQLSDFARSTPFEFTQLTTASKQLLAYGVSAEDIIPTLTNLGNIAAGVGTDKLPQLMLAFGQVKAATVLTGAELRQFSEAGVPLLDALATQAGKSAKEMKEAISDGAVSFEDVKKALEGMSGEGGKFFNLMEKQSKTFGGVMSNVKDSVTRSLAEIAGIDIEAGGKIREGSLFAVMKQGAEKLLQALEILTPKLVEFANWVAQNQVVLGAIAGVIGGLLIAVLVGLIAAFGSAIAIALAFAAAGAALGAAIVFIVQHFNTWKQAVIDTWIAIQTFFVDTLPTAIATTVTSIITWFSLLPAAIQEYVYNLFVERIPFAIGFMIGYLSVAIPQIISNIITWFSQLPGRVAAIFEAVKQWVIDKITAMVGWLAAQLSALPGKVEGWISAIPGIAANIFEAAKKAVLGKMSEMFSGVNDWWNKIKGVLEGIKNAAEAAFNAVQRGLNAGKGSGGRQAGGIVPGPIDSPQMVLAHGGEEIVPVDKKSASGSVGGGMSFTVNIGLYAGSEIEKRNIARELYASLTQLAAAENKTVAEMMGR